MRALPLAARALALGACAHTQPAADGSAGLVRHADELCVTVVLYDGRAFPADALRVEADWVSWLDLSSRALGWASMADPRGIIVPAGRARGARGGLLTGAAVGTVGGALVGARFLTGSDGSCFPTTCSHLEAAATFGGLGGAVGTGGGLGVGALNGSSTHYTLRSAE